MKLTLRWSDFIVGEVYTITLINPNESKIMVIPYNGKQEKFIKIKSRITGDNKRHFDLILPLYKVKDAMAHYSNDEICEMVGHEVETEIKKLKRSKMEIKVIRICA